MAGIPPPGPVRAAHVRHTADGRDDDDDESIKGFSGAWAAVDCVCVRCIFPARFCLHIRVRVSTSQCCVCVYVCGALTRSRESLALALRSMSHYTSGDAGCHAACSASILHPRLMCAVLYRLYCCVYMRAYMRLIVALDQIYTRA